MWRAAAALSRPTNEMEDCLILAIQLQALLVASEVVVVVTEGRLVDLQGVAGLVEAEEREPIAASDLPRVVVGGSGAAEEEATEDIDTTIHAILCRLIQCCTLF